MTENYLFRDLCRHHPHKECDLCESCFEEVYNLNDYNEDEEPSDAYIEAWIERQMLAEELKFENI